MADDKITIDIINPKDSTSDEYLKQIKDLLQQSISSSNKPEGRSGKDPSIDAKKENKEDSEGGLFSNLLTRARKSFFGPFDKLLMGIIKKTSSSSLKETQKAAETITESFKDASKEITKATEKISNAQLDAATKVAGKISDSINGIDGEVTNEATKAIESLSKTLDKIGASGKEGSKDDSKSSKDPSEIDDPLNSLKKSLDDAKSDSEDLGDELNNAIDPTNVSSRFSKIKKAGQVAGVVIAASLVKVGQIGVASIAAVGKAYSEFVNFAANKLLDSSKKMISSNSLFIDKEIADLMQRTGQTAVQAQGTQRALDRLGLSMEDVQSGKLTAAQAKAFEDVRNKEIEKLKELEAVGTQAFDAIQGGQMMFMQLQQDLQDKVTLALAKAGPAISKVMDILSSTIDQLMPVVDAIMPSITELVSILPGIIEPLVPVVITLANAIAEIMPFIIEIVQTVLDPLGEILSNILPPLIALVQMLLPHLVKIFNILMPVVIKLSEVIGKVIEAISPFLDILLNILVPALVILSEILSFVLDVLKPIIEVFKFFGEGIQSIQKAIMDFLTSIGLGGLFGEKQEVSEPLLGASTSSNMSSSTTTNNVSNYNYGQIQTTGNSNTSPRQVNGVMLNLTVI